MISLVLPDHDRWNSWLDAMSEFEGADLHGFATFGYDEMDLGEPDVFEAWLERERLQRTAGQGGFVPATVWWVVDDANPRDVLGSIHLRHELNDFLLAEGGHIGYGIRPTARGRGVASAALQISLDKARTLGLERVLVICEAGNVASRKTIIAAGGILEDAPGTRERYWIPIAPQPDSETAH